MAPSLRSFRALALLTTTVGLVACSAVDHAIISTENGASRIFTSPDGRTPPPAIDMQALSWRNLNATSPTQFALVGDGEAKSGATRVVLKVPAGESVPAFWQDAPGSYTVLSGTFVAEALDSSGLPQHVVQGPGTTTRVPARMIQKLASTAAGEGTMLLTVQGQWKPNFVDDTSSVHASN
jgi:hypothetical protein